MMERVSLLLVDDEPLLRLAMQEVLEGGGYDVLLASNDEEAFAILGCSDCSPVGLVTDIRLGSGANGWDVARRARQHDATISVVYVTGDSAEQWAAEGVPNSIVLQKPFADAQLLTAISSLLNTREAKAEF